MKFFFWYYKNYIIKKKKNSPHCHAALYLGVRLLVQESQINGEEDE